MLKTRHSILNTQFGILLDHYIESYSEIVEFANKHCNMFFEAETSGLYGSGNL